MRSLKSLQALAGTGAAAAYLLMAGTAHALDSTSAINPTGSSSFTGPVDFKTQFAAVAGNVLNVLLLISGIVAIFYLVWSGFQYITAGGSPDKVKAARAGIINAVIGIVIIVAAYFIVQFAINLGGVVAPATPTS